MLRSPGLYRVGPEYENDTVMEQRRVDLVHAAAHVLEKCSLIKYDRKSGALRPTELSCISSYYYISHNSMAIYNLHVQPGISAIELFRVFALSEEFGRSSRGHGIWQLGFPFERRRHASGCNTSTYLMLSLFVQQISQRAKTRHLRVFFEAVGPVADAQIVKDRVTGRSNGPHVKATLGRRDIQGAHCDRA
jgi:hypothetical protein